MYIPDITERFPEGFGGVDMTPSYFGEPVDWTQSYGYEPAYEEIIESEEIKVLRRFNIGDEYQIVGIYGGITIYTVKEIDREHNRILFEEVWIDVDGIGTRPDEWHKLKVDENGNERALEWTSKEYRDFWIYAKEVNV